VSDAEDGSRHRPDPGTDDPSADPVADDAARPFPSDAAGWRALLASLPARDLLRLIQTDKVRAARVFRRLSPRP
jgi:hypothetical protein